MLVCVCICVCVCVCVCVYVCVCSSCRVAVQAYHECILVLSERKWDFEMSEKPRRQLALCA